MSHKLHFLLTGTGTKANNRLKQALKSFHAPENEKIPVNIKQLITSITHKKNEIESKECTYRVKENQGYKLHNH